MSAPSAGLETNMLHLPMRFTNPTTQNVKQKLFWVKTVQNSMTLPTVIVIYVLKM